MFYRGDRWYTDFYHEGVRYKKSFGAVSKGVAKERERKFRTEVTEGKHTQKSKRILFETFVEKYLDYARLNKKAKSAKRNEVSINMLKPYFSGKQIGSLHPFVVEQYKKARKDEGRAPATINRDVVTLKNIMKKAVEWGYLSQNPLMTVKQLKEDNEQMWVLTADEEKKLLEACQKSPQRRKKRYLKDLVLFALHSGMRLNEIFSLRKDHVNLKGRFILVTGTKNDENRTVPINDTLKEVLEKRLGDPTSEYVFCNSKGNKLTVLTNAFWYAVKCAGLIRRGVIRGETRKIRFRFHDLRHTFGSRLGMAGKDLKTIMEIMGHKTTKVAMRYQHPAPDHKLDAVRALDRITPEVTPHEKNDSKVVNMYG